MVRWWQALPAILLFVGQRQCNGLRVATCTDGRAPYVQYNANTGVVTGFEVELWNLVYPLLRQEVVQEWTELQPLVPAVQPDFLLMPMVDVEASLENSTIDVGFCALAYQPESEETTDRFTSTFDFLPVHLHSGIQVGAPLF